MPAHTPATERDHTRFMDFLRKTLEKSPIALVMAVAAAASFLAYLSMYAFRKPFVAALYAGKDGAPLMLGGGLDTLVTLKTALILSQLCGYTLSKFLGIRYLPGVGWESRARWLGWVIGTALLSLLLLAVLPGPWKLVAMFVNGLPLGFVWGLVVGYLEGRRAGEVLLAVLSCAFIFGSDLTKDVGRWMLNTVGVAENWMPLAVAAMFLPLFAASVAVLASLPRPDARDVAERQSRPVMDSAARGAFLRRFAPGLFLLLLLAVALMGYRDYRDNFAVDILGEIGLASEATALTRSSLWTSLGVLGALALLSLVRDNARGLLACFSLMVAGLLMVALGTVAFRAGLIGGFAWLTLTGLGSYLTYVPMGSMLFDRLIAHTRHAGTAVYAIYLVDGVGYLGSAGVQLYKDIWASTESRLDFFVNYTWGMCLLGVVCLVISCFYFLRQKPA